MKLRHIKKCPVCSGEQFIKIYKEDGVPVVLRPLGVEEITRLKRKNVPESIPLELGMCRDCAHIFMAKQPDNLFFDELYSFFYASHISRMKQRLGVGDINQFVKLFINTLKQKKKYRNGLKILEIGCFDGYLMSIMAEHGFSPFGCDPSEAAVTGIDSGLNIQRAFFSEDVFCGMNFDCIYSRHVLEHMQSPVSVLDLCAKRLKEDGLVFIEVPNGDYALKQGYVYPFHIEHISTFTTASLSCACQQAGFDIIGIHNKDRNLVVVAEKRKKDSNDPFMVEKTLSLGKRFSDTILTYNNDIGSFITSNFTGDAKTAVWGAGASGIRFLNTFAHMLPVAPVIVDRAKSKQGLAFYSFSDQIVHNPAYLVAHPVDYIIVTSQFYKEIVQDIRNLYQLEAKILPATSPKESISVV